MNISRREFFIRSAETLAVISTTGLVSTIISSCGGNGPTGPSNVNSLTTIQGTVSNNKISINLGSSSPIANTNTRALVVYNGGSGGIIVEHNSDNTFKAISAICTHQGCMVSGFDGTDFVCPCHGSKFNLNGSVVQGPAPSSLRQYTTSVAGNTLTINL